MFRETSPSNLVNITKFELYECNHYAKTNLKIRSLEYKAVNCNSELRCLRKLGKIGLEPCACRSDAVE